MKRKTIVLVAAILAIFLAAPVVLSAQGLPAPIQQAYNRVSRDYYFRAVGYARRANTAVSRNAAIINVRGLLANTLGSLVEARGIDHITSLEINDCPITLAFFDEAITLAARARLLGAEVIEEYRRADGNHWETWVVMVLPRAIASEEITAASEAAAAYRSSVENHYITINQTNDFYNEFHGDRAGQERSYEAMDKASDDVTGELARALSYVR